MKYAIINTEMSKNCRLSLEKLGFEILALPPAKYLSSSLSYHPDMLIFIGFGNIFCHEDYYADNRELIDRIAETLSMTVKTSSERTSDKYPYDVLFNAALVGNNLICNKKYISKEILSAADSSGIKIIHTPQGYAKCNSCIVSDSALITSDISIYKACLENSIDALLISSGNIALSGYDYGFIGGSSGLSENILYFCGDVSTHVDFFKISAFCEKHGRSVISLSKEPLSDLGSIFFV